MKRRQFLKSAAALAAVTTVASKVRAEDAPPAGSREIYQLRLYHLRSGAPANRFDKFLRDAAIPAWNRAGINPVGVFSVTVGPDSPTMRVLLPAPSFDALLAAEQKVLSDPEYLKAGADFLDAPYNDPGFVRVDSSLLLAFAGMPKLDVPPATPRIFELRTYESPSEKAAAKKIEMFNTAEMTIFRRVGFRPVFFGQTLVGANLPNLTYMLAFADLDERAKSWAAFSADADWKKLSGAPEFANTVSSITNLILQPARYSQI